MDNERIVGEISQSRDVARWVCLANCYAGRFYLLHESELSLTFGTDLVAGKRSDRGARCDWEPAKDFLEFRRGRPNTAARANL
jgi:hypothetical protein